MAADGGLRMMRWPIVTLVLTTLAASAAAQAPSVVYRCPGPPVLYTDQLSAQDAKERGCRVVEGAPVTVVQTPRPRAPASSPGPGATSTASSRPVEARVDPAEQRSRDSDARRILSEELRREEARLADMQREYNNGEPERRGDERNYQRYLDRVAEMKSAIQRKEADIAAIKREIAKLPQ
jgi:hypothetical protein